jgi:hypothetical protein
MEMWPAAVTNLIAAESAEGLGRSNGAIAAFLELGLITGTYLQIRNTYPDVMTWAGYNEGRKLARVTDPAKGTVHKVDYGGA